MGIPWSFKRNFTGAKEIKDTNDYLSRIGRAIGTLDSMPVGFNMPWWSDTLPSSKYMFMEGQSLASYPEARAVFGDYLPDLRGRVMVHKSADTEFNAIKKTGGAKTHTIGITEIPPHRHPIRGAWGAATAGSFDDGFTRGDALIDDNFRTGGEICAISGTHGLNGYGSAVQTQVPMSLLQPYIVCRYIAKVLP